MNISNCGGLSVGKAIAVSSTTWDTEVGKADGLVLVDFWAVWCGPCQMVAPIVEELAKEYDGKIKVLKLNTEENTDTGGKCGTTRIRSLIDLQARHAAEQTSSAR